MSTRRFAWLTAGATFAFLVFLYGQQGSHNDFQTNNFFHIFSNIKSTLQSEPSTDFIDLAQHELTSETYYPYPQQKSSSWQGSSRASLRACKGVKGIRADQTAADLIKARATNAKCEPDCPSSTVFARWLIPHNLASNPAPFFGSYDETGLDATHCFDSRGRLGPYDFAQDFPLADNMTALFDWDDVKWGELQDQCMKQNQEYFDSETEWEPLSHLQMPWNINVATKPSQTVGEKKAAHHPRRSEVPSKKARTAVVLRGWDSLDYTVELRQNIRAMINELNLHSGGEYAVYLLVEIKDAERRIWDTDSEYLEALCDSVPPEFRSLTLLFNEDLLNTWYPKLDASHGGQSLHMNMPLQLFSLFNPQFDHVWGIELDVRFTGNWYHLLSTMSSWSRKQPRRLQWERAANFYIPSYHGTYAKYNAAISQQYPGGGIWGPVMNARIPNPIGPTPPTRDAEDDDFTWGVGEEADDITNSAVINTFGTSIFNYFPVHGFGPESSRRALMVTPVKRLSRQLLAVMHDAQIQGLDMRSELYAHTIALAHGLKVAHFPMPMYYDDPSATGEEVNAIFNDENGSETAGNLSTRARIWADGADEVQLQAMSKTTFWWRLEFEQFPRKLYRKWYGLDEDGRWRNGGENTDGEGRLCLPAMMLHPIKDVVKE